MSTAEHAFLPPSGAGAWVHCPLWPTMNQRYPEMEATPESMEGTGAHWVLAETWADRQPREGQFAPNGQPVTDEMLDGAEVAVDYLQRLGVPFAVEQMLRGNRVHATLNWGTPDFTGRDQFTIHIADYKFGFEQVEVVDWWQGINYAALLGIDGFDDQNVTVIFHILQPRAYHREGICRSHKVKLSDLRAQFNILKMAADAACQPKPVATPGDYCKHCPGRAACPALQSRGYAAVSLGRQEQPHDMDARAAGLELHLLERESKLLEARITGLREQVTAMMKRGDPSPLWAISSTPGREQWTIPVDEVATLGRMLGLELTRPKPVTPKQARDAGLPKDVSDLYSQRPQPSFKLSPADTKFARRIFG